MSFINVNQLVKATVASTLLMFAFGSSAALISGDVTFSGDWDSMASTDSTSLITFPGGDLDVDGSSGDFSGIAQGSSGTLSTLDFGALGAFASIGGFDFTLTDIVVTFQNSSFIVIEGTAVASGNGFMDTTMDFFFTANESGSLQNFSAGFTARPVPVPGALILFGSALAGLGLRRRS